MTSVKSNSEVAARRADELLKIVAETYTLAHDVENDGEDARAANDRYRDAWVELPLVLMQAGHRMSFENNATDHHVESTCSAVWTSEQVDLMGALFALDGDDQRVELLTQLARTMGGEASWSSLGLRVEFGPFTFTVTRDQWEAHLEERKRLSDWSRMRHLQKQSEEIAAEMRRLEWADCEAQKKLLEREARKAWRPRV